MTASQEATRRGDPTIGDLWDVVRSLLVGGVPAEARLLPVKVVPDSGEFQGDPGRVVVDVEWTA